MHDLYDDDGDLAHYYRFEQLKYGARVPRLPTGRASPPAPAVGVDFDAVYPMLPNPRAADYADPDLRAASAAANREWSRLLRQLDRAFDGAPETLVPAVHTMFRLRDATLVLLANPLPDHDGRHAGPTFEWAEPEDARTDR